MGNLVWSKKLNPKAAPVSTSKSDNGMIFYALAIDGENIVNTLAIILQSPMEVAANIGGNS